ESIAMLIYLAQRYGPTALLPLQDPARLARVLQLTELGEATLAAGINPLISARVTAPEADKHNWSVRAAEQRIGAAVSYAAAQLGERRFFLGDELTLADISVSPAL